MFGWRGRLGLIVPSVNSVMEPEIGGVAPEGVSVHAARMGVEGDYCLAHLVEMGRDAVTAARLLAPVSDVIVFGCTSGSFAKGPGYDEQLIEELIRETGKRVTTTSTSLVRALKYLGVSRVSLATPYTREANEKQVEFLGAHGFKVIREKGLGVSVHGGQGVYAPATAFRLAREVDDQESEAVVISCTNFRTFGIIEELERDLGKPVITSNQASLWDMLTMAGIHDEIEGLGQLFVRH